MIRSVERIRKDNEKSGKPSWGIRIGITHGDLVAGVIGKSKFAYDIWGSAVNIASRMESAGEPGKVNVSE
ncbi:MAG: adenylate/guanylate cyclase domain-containing protein [Bacteroidota bacterium]